MPKTGPYDELVARKEDGYSQDIWDSDTDKGRERIREREAAANAPRITRRQSGNLSRKEWENLTEAIAAQFAEERRKLRLDIREALVEAREELGGMLASALKIERSIEKLLIEKKVTPLVRGGKDAA